MSIALTNAVYGRELSAKLQRVLLILCDFANDDGVCWPSLGLMAWKLNLNERTIRRAIDELEAQKVITIDHRAGQSSRFHIDLSALPLKPPYSGRTAGQIVHTPEKEAPDKMSTVEDADHGQNVHPTPDILSSTPDILSTNRRTNCPPEPIEPPREPPEEPPIPQTPTALERRFEEFWRAYPRKTAKLRAFDRWKKIKPDEDLTTRIIAAIEAQKLSAAWKRDNGQYIPHPATWLSDGRWEDEVMPAKPKRRYVV